MSDAFTITAGTYFILIEADPDHNVHESDETNNIVSVPISIISAPGLWIGGTGNWEEENNWCGGIVPTATDNVIIPAGAEVQVTSVPGTPAVCNNLTINVGGSLTIEAGKALTVSSTLTNNGTLELKSDASGIASLKMGSHIDNGTENISIVSYRRRWHKCLEMALYFISCRQCNYFFSFW